jgi:hypothetical protein
LDLFSGRIHSRRLGCVGILLGIVVHHPDKIALSHPQLEKCSQSTGEKEKCKRGERKNVDNMEIDSLEYDLL